MATLYRRHHPPPLYRFQILQYAPQLVLLILRVLLLYLQCLLTTLMVLVLLAVDGCGSQEHPV
jgi:hypothetical protein